jgi:hypothetical protein
MLAAVKAHAARQARHAPVEAIDTYVVVRVD